MGHDPPDPREHEEYFENMDLEEIHDHLTTIEVKEIRDPEEAANERGNPVVEVKVREFEKVFERYSFEFMRPPEDAEYPRYRLAVHGFTEGASLSKHYNKALRKAAEALMEYTNTPVSISLKPTKELIEMEKRNSETAQF